MNPVWLLMCAVGVVGSNSLVLSPIAQEVAQSFPGQTAPDVLLASAVYGAGTALSALLLAPKADQIGLHRALLLAMSGLAASLALSAVSPMLWMLVLAQGLAGAAAGLALPAIYGLAADAAPKGRESETLGKVLTGWTLSLVAGVSLAAILSDVIHWRAVYVLLAGGSLALVLSLRGANFGSKPSDAPAASPLKALRIEGLMPILMAVLAYMVAFYGLYGYIGTHVKNVLGQPTWIVGLVAVSYGVGFGAVTPWDKLIDRFGAKRAAPFVFAGLLSAYTLLAVVSGSTAAVFAACVLWGALNHLGLNILVGQLTALSPDRRGAILGLYSAVTYAAMFAGTAAFKPVFEAYGLQAVAVLSALCIFPALVGTLKRHTATQNSNALPSRNSG